MKKETKQLHTWYGIVQNDEDAMNAWADAVMSDPENSIIFTRLENCAVKSIEMLLRLAERDSDPETIERVQEAMRGVFNVHPNET